MTKFSQGLSPRVPWSVQGVQGAVQGAVQGLSPRVPWSVQGVQGSPIRDARDKKHSTPKIYAYLSRVYSTLHTLHTLHRLYNSRDTLVQGTNSDPAHPAQHSIYLLFIKKMKEERNITCGPDNIESFKKELKTAIPGVFPFIRGLYDAGMIAGLRGVKLTYTTAQDPESEASDVKQPELQQYCRDCQAYRPDIVGDGTGIGQCTESVKTRRLKYPMTEVCEIFKEIA